MDKQNNNGVMQHMIDTLIHKQYMLQSTIKMIEYLYQEGREADALELAKRASVHDHSKLCMDEIKQFVQMPIEKKGKKPNGRLTKEQRKLIEMHWSRNRHHPEFHKDYHDMSEIDVLEMVCDWYARACQFESDFGEFVNTIPQERFGFEGEFLEKVLKYCEVLNN